MKWEDLEKFDSTDMKRHILEQGKALELTMKRSESDAKHAATLLSRCDNLFLIGSGDKYLIPMISQYIWRKYGDIPVQVFDSRDFADHPPSYLDQDSCCVLLSQSGKTRDTMDALKVCMKRKATCIGITNLREGG